MHDRLEGTTPIGTIVTGAERHRVPVDFEPILDAVSARVAAIDPDAAVYLYGSVATGRARRGRSDVDLLVIDLDGDIGRRLGLELSARFAELCRGVEIGSATSDDLSGGRSA